MKQRFPNQIFSDLYLPDKIRKTRRTKRTQNNRTFGRELYEGKSYRFHKYNNIATGNLSRNEILKEYTKDKKNRSIHRAPTVFGYSEKYINKLKKEAKREMNSLKAKFGNCYVHQYFFDFVQKNFSSEPIKQYAYSLYFTEIHPGNPFGYYYLALALTHFEKYPDAIKLLYLALSDCPSSLLGSKIYKTLGFCYTKKRKFEQALDSYTQALYTDPNCNHRFLLGRALYYSHIHSTDATEDIQTLSFAIRYLESSIQNGYELNKKYYYLGLCYIEKARLSLPLFEQLELLEKAQTYLSLSLEHNTPLEAQAFSSPANAIHATPNSKK